MKAARVTIDQAALQLALAFHLDWQVTAAQIDYTFPERPQLQLIVTGDGLPDEFLRDEGTPIRDAYLIVHERERDAEIIPARP